MYTIYLWSSWHMWEEQYKLNVEPRIYSNQLHELDMPFWILQLKNLNEQRQSNTVT
jgi:hypothetical protein